MRGSQHRHRQHGHSGKVHVHKNGANDGRIFGHIEQEMSDLKFGCVTTLLSRGLQMKVLVTSKYFHFLLTFSFFFLFVGDGSKSDTVQAIELHESILLSCIYIYRRDKPNYIHQTEVVYYSAAALPLVPFSSACLEKQKETRKNAQAELFLIFAWPKSLEHFFLLFCVIFHLLCTKELKHITSVLSLHCLKAQKLFEISPSSKLVTLGEKEQSDFQRWGVKASGAFSSHWMCVPSDGLTTNSVLHTSLSWHPRITRLDVKASKFQASCLVSSDFSDWHENEPKITVESGDNCAHVVLSRLS